VSPEEVGIDPLRDLYDLRHTYATFALRAGVPVFALSRFMGTSIAMIDLHYGHLAVDSYQHAVSLLDALALERAVDAGWTPARRPAKLQRDTVSGPHRRRLSAGVDTRWTLGVGAVATRANNRARLAATSQSPLTDSNRRPPPYHGGKGFGLFQAFSRTERLRLIATGCARWAP